jgi:hypothetical protein
MVTFPVELPSPPITQLGNSVSDVGTAACALTVSSDCTLAPFQLAVIVTTVSVVTVPAKNDTPPARFPAGTVTVAGGRAAGELLERLTTAPPAGARPFNSTVTPTCPPPLMMAGAVLTNFSDGGKTVTSPGADTPLRVAVSVTGVGVVT